jgi:hypothetical protein
MQAEENHKTHFYNSTQCNSKKVLLPPESGVVLTSTTRREFQQGLCTQKRPQRSRAHYGPFRLQNAANRLQPPDVRRSIGSPIDPCMANVNATYCAKRGQDSFLRIQAVTGKRVLTPFRSSLYFKLRESVRHRQMGRQVAQNLTARNVHIEPKPAEPDHRLWRPTRGPKCTMTPQMTAANLTAAEPPLQ